MRSSRLLCGGWWVVLVILPILAVLTPGILRSPGIILMAQTKRNINFIKATIWFKL